MQLWKFGNIIQNILHLGRLLDQIILCDAATRIQQLHQHVTDAIPVTSWLYQFSFCQLNVQLRHALEDIRMTKDWKDELRRRITCRCQVHGTGILGARRTCTSWRSNRVLICGSFSALPKTLGVFQRWNSKITVTWLYPSILVLPVSVFEVQVRSERK